MTGNAVVLSSGAQRSREIFALVQRVERFLHFAALQSKWRIMRSSFLAESNAAETLDCFSEVKGFSISLRCSRKWRIMRSSFRAERNAAEKSLHRISELKGFSVPLRFSRNDDYLEKDLRSFRNFVSLSFASLQTFIAAPQIPALPNLGFQFSWNFRQWGNLENQLLLIP